LTVVGGAPAVAAVARIVADRLEHYVQRGVFRGSSRVRLRGGVASFRVVWHGGRTYEVVADAVRRTLRLTGALPAVPARSEMDRELRRFVASRQFPDRPAHRRIDPAKVRARCANRAGEVSIAFEVLDEDWDYAVRKLVHLVDEIFQIFLCDGRWYEYRTEHLGVDADRD
jgi:hypothetical protein